jgi:hypothetical protein
MTATAHSDGISQEGKNFDETGIKELDPRLREDDVSS